MTRAAWSILYEDNHLLVMNKPAGMATMGAAAGEVSLHAEACRYLKQKFHKPGNVYLGVVSRLDALVSGVVVFARTSKAAARLSQQFREGTTSKIYWAVVEQAPSPVAGECEDWLVKDEAAHRMCCVPAENNEGQEARLRYRTRQRMARGALLEIELLTGRKHQIRVQLASRGWPIVGDRKYGAKSRFSAGIALHSRRLTIEHPVSHQRLTFEAPLPKSWQS